MPFEWHMSLSYHHNSSCCKFHLFLYDTPETWHESQVNFQEITGNIMSEESNHYCKNNILFVYPHFLFWGQLKKSFETFACRQENESTFINWFNTNSIPSSSGCHFVILPPCYFPFIRGIVFGFCSEYEQPEGNRVNKNKWEENSSVASNM